MNKKEIYVYDIETYPNIFTFVFRKVSSKRIILKFEISARKNDLEALISFLNTKGLILVGFNNVHFDYPVLHHLLNLGMKFTVDQGYKNVERIINKTNPYIPSWKVKIPQIDLFKINHYDNPNRSTSLKWLEFALRWHKLQDLPFPPGTVIIPSNFDFLLEYNLNDVDFTYKFLGKCLDAIVFREQMSQILRIDVMNYSDVKIGEYLNQITYSRLSGRSYSDYKDLRSYRGLIKVKDLIPNYIKFKTPYMQEFLNDIKTESFDIDKDYEKHISFGGINMKFAKGGLHSDDTAKIFFCKEGYKLKEKDVGSMYPASIINGRLYPEHLGPNWNEGIKLLFEERAFVFKPQMKKLDKKSKEYKALDSKQNAYKLAMNGGGYGKTGSEYSWQYDPLVMLQVTFKGQLSLLMLLEEYHLLGYVDLISANTDGIVIHYPKDKEDEIQRIHDEWEKTTKYILEDTSYSRLIYRDVNNYIAEIIDEDTEKRIKMKFKGCFEFDQEFHKNSSQRIVPIALMEYFINGVPVKDTISNIGYEFINSKGDKEKTSIFDYCIARKSNSKVDNYSLLSKGEITELNDKVIRFYISNTRDKLVKVYESGKTEAVNKGFNHTVFMNYLKLDDYNINFRYYIHEANKIIKLIERGTRQMEQPQFEQLNLF